MQKVFTMREGSTLSRPMIDSLGGVRLKVVLFSFAVHVFIDHLLRYLRTRLPVYFSSMYYKISPMHVPFHHIRPYLDKAVWYALPRQTIILGGTFYVSDWHILVLTYKDLSPSLLSAIQKF